MGQRKLPTGANTVPGRASSVDAAWKVAPDTSQGLLEDEAWCRGGRNQQEPHDQREAGMTRRRLRRERGRKQRHFWFQLRLVGQPQRGKREYPSRQVPSSSLASTQ